MSRDVFRSLLVLSMLLAAACGDDKKDKGPSLLDGGDGGEGGDDGGTRAALEEILGEVAPGTAWADVPAGVKAALEAYVGDVTEAYAAQWDAAGLAAAAAALVDEPTAAMDENFETWLRTEFAVEAGETFALADLDNGDFEAALRRLYLVRYATRGTFMYTYHGMPAVDWDGETFLDRHPLPVPSVVAAHKAYAATLLTELEAFDAADLSDLEEALREKARVLARQAKRGTLGFSTGADDLLTPVGIGYYGWDLLFEHGTVDAGGLELLDDEAFYAQSAVFFAEPSNQWLNAGVANALDDIFVFTADPNEAAYWLGAGTKGTIWTLLVSWYLERTRADALAAAPCTAYTDAERTAIWDGLTADNYMNSGGEVSMADFQTTFEGYADDEVTAYRARVLAAIEDFRVRNSLEPGDVAAAVTAAGSEPKAGRILAAAADALSGDVKADFAAEQAALTTVGGYDDPNATVSNDDAMRVQAAWDRVRDYLEMTYGFADTDLVADVTVENQYTSGAAPDGSIVIGLADPFTLGEVYSVLLHEAHHNVNFISGRIVEGAAWEGAAVVAERERIEALLDYALPLEGGGETAKKYFYLLAATDLARYLATTDAVLAGYFRANCDAGEDTLVEDGEAIAAEWGLTDEEAVAYVPVRAVQGTQYLSYSLGDILYTDALATLNDGWAESIDAFGLLRCGLPNPNVSPGGLAATRATLEACLD